MKYNPMEHNWKVFLCIYHIICNFLCIRHFYTAWSIYIWSKHYYSTIRHCCNYCHFTGNRTKGKKHKHIDDSIGKFLFHISFSYHIWRVYQRHILQSIHIWRYEQQPNIFFFCDNHYSLRGRHTNSTIPIRGEPNQSNPHHVWHQMIIFAQ